MDRWMDRWSRVYIIMDEWIDGVDMIRYLINYKIGMMKCVEHEMSI